MVDHPSADSLSVARWLTEFVLIASTLAALPLVSGTTDASDVENEKFHHNLAKFSSEEFT
ncbi:hypothetical protein C1H46_040398 [Malus baccata]|uniref:Uncharacterized protein n=1 Tax=Malus baccata TaxID=106549 RepID=A0A540KIQ7_MALBA|nr:hypothetical protein C1H46_040398 [Malus baccata]